MSLIKAHDIGRLLHFLFPEYIVGFNGYYTEKARKGFITAALEDVDVKLWTVLARNNALSKYPSDFDVIRVRNIS